MSASRGKRRGKKKLSPFTLAGVIVLCLVLCGTVTYKTATLKSQVSLIRSRLNSLKSKSPNLKMSKLRLKSLRSMLRQMITWRRLQERN